jgi:hypothetical protein
MRSQATLLRAAASGLGVILLAGPALAQNDATIEIAPMPDWSIRKEVDKLDNSMRNYSSLINSLSRASNDLGEEFEAYLKDPQNELLASSVEKKMAIYAATVMQDFEHIIADQDLLGANFRELQRKLVAFSKHLGNQSKGFKLKLDDYRGKAKSLESELVELSIQIKEDPPADPVELRALKKKFAMQFRRYRLQTRYVNGYGARYKNYLKLQDSMGQLAGLFVNLHDKFNELIDNLENERTYLDDSIRLQADKIRIQQILREGIIGSEQAIGKVAEKLADLYNKVDAFTQVHERINSDLNQFVQSQEALLEVTRKIDAIGTSGGGMQNLAQDMEMAIDAFYQHRNEPLEDKLLVEKEKEKQEAAEAERKRQEAERKKAEEARRNAPPPAPPVRQPQPQPPSATPPARQPQPQPTTPPVRQPQPQPETPAPAPGGAR